MLNKCISLSLKDERFLSFLSKYATLMEISSVWSSHTVKWYRRKQLYRQARGSNYNNIFVSAAIRPRTNQAFDSRRHRTGDRTERKSWMEIHASTSFSRGRGGGLFWHDVKYPSSDDEMTRYRHFTLIRFEQFPPMIGRHRRRTNPELAYGTLLRYETFICQPMESASDRYFARIVTYRRVISAGSYQASIIEVHI